MHRFVIEIKFKIKNSVRESIFVKLFAQTVENLQLYFLYFIWKFYKTNLKNYINIIKFYKYNFTKNSILLKFEYPNVTSAKSFGNRHCVQNC